MQTTTPLSPEDPPEIGGFELLARIGQGGMGQVYLGESPGGEQAAVKVIKPSLVDSETRLRFAQEIEILKTVWGNRVAAFLDADPEAEPPWLATEYVEGADLRRHVDAYGPLPAVLVASLGATLAEALALVHKQGLLHRDLKPVLGAGGRPAARPGHQAGGLHRTGPGHRAPDGRGGRRRNADRALRARRGAGSHLASQWSGSRADDRDEQRRGTGRAAARRPPRGTGTMRRSRRRTERPTVAPGATALFQHCAHCGVGRRLRS
ncbi:protein kinase domain-containing protein [Kitasatospora aureofaciens]|uniref:protein kinase domain-containing protein n=1 Tax=Kitasatospora aureofaciens TaxID=1894 RepID=UPI0033E7F4E1